MGAYTLKDKSLKINNLKYYRSNGTQLGDVGTKKKSVFSVNRVDSQSNIPAPKMKVRYGETIDMDAELATSIAGMMNYGGLSVAGFEKKLRRGDLKLTRYFMQNRNMEEAIEKSPKLIETIRSIGRDARVVSDVWVVEEAAIHEVTKGGGLFNFKSAASGVALVDQKSTIALSPGSVLAYMLQKIDWKEKQKKNWSTIDKLDEDPKGL